MVFAKAQNGVYWGAQSLFNLSFLPSRNNVEKGPQTTTAAHPSAPHPRTVGAPAGYGLTETTAVSNCCDREDGNAGHVGAPLVSCEMKLLRAVAYRPAPWVQNCSPSTPPCHLLRRLQARETPGRLKSSPPPSCRCPPPTKPLALPRLFA